MPESQLAPAAGPVVEASRAEELCAIVAGASALFYYAEVGSNPAMGSYWDAVNYVAACLSTGYAQIYPVTPLGKLIGSAVLTFGPALSMRALDRPGGDPEILGRLDAIIAELRRVHGDPVPTSSGSPSE
jgi:hypothetical protein